MCNLVYFYTPLKLNKVDMHLEFSQVESFNTIIYIYKYIISTFPIDRQLQQQTEKESSGIQKTDPLSLDGNSPLVWPR